MLFMGAKLCGGGGGVSWGLVRGKRGGDLDYGGGGGGGFLREGNTALGGGGVGVGLRVEGVGGHCWWWGGEVGGGGGEVGGEERW